MGSAFDAPGIEAGHWNTSLTTFSLNRLHDTHAGQPGRVALCGRHNISIRLRIVCDRFDAEHCAHFVHQLKGTSSGLEVKRQIGNGIIQTYLTLFSIHNRKRVAARLLSTLFGQFNQFGELVMDHIHQFCVLLCPAANKFRIFWLQFRWQIGIANLQADRETSIAFVHATFLGAFERLVVGHFDGTEHVAQFDHAAALHLLHARCQLRCGDLAIVRREVLTGAHLLAQPALTQHLDHFAARRVRTRRVQMARCVAFVRAHDARFFRATLLAHLGVGLARAIVAGLLALVLTAFERLVARQAAAEVVLTARNNFALLVLAVTPLRGEGHARRTVLGRVAVVRDRVVAGVRAGARFVAGRTLGAAWDGRIDDVRAALAVQLVERCAIAWLKGRRRRLREVRRTGGESELTRQRPL